MVMARRLRGRVGRRGSREGATLRDETNPRALHRFQRSTAGVSAAVLMIPVGPSAVVLMVPAGLSAPGLAALAAEYCAQLIALVLP